MEEQMRIMIMDQIHDTMRKFLNEADSAPIRILGDTPTKILDSKDYLKSISAFVEKVQESVRECRRNVQTRFLAVNIYPGRHSYFVLDLNNIHYNYDTAHNDVDPIPVYVLRLSRRPRIFRFKDQDEKLAIRLAEMHNGHGKDPLPLFDDFTKTVQYHSPRSLQS
ncbi:hypothetical protein CBS76997_11395 [Aspergillus niger]|uniref:Uncharacterized protein n=1 Tax=Aspergillus niger TaxID=5061 RepID=A0A9W6ADG6_ASPNG|nr:hypothetical protein CBS13152_11437 [Aspergillus niger]KAI2870434.1 hypothetical protein CBS11852_11100 [Aspergillus niger]KAI2956728.1 hypothetical protein CBS147323_9145 [Aspergillus niger]KAI3032186.1 hypothetical protein CBS76997_11395 [Aspergillus niger]GLA55911.1 hypothetical protein AnigIFM63604_003130 [Aspergillus niger]